MTPDPGAAGEGREREAPGERGGAVREERRDGAGYPLFVHAAWEARFPALAAGITAAGCGPGGDEADFGLTTAGPAWTLFERLEGLAGQLGFPAAAVGRQVHGDAVTCLSPAPEPGLRVPGESDGLVTDAAGLLLVVTAADCVPVYLLDPVSGGLGLLHAGWRGVAAGILSSGVRAMGARFGAAADRLRLHLGPAVCGSCYEVGPEVPEALGLPTRASSDTLTVDLRDELVRRARRLGLGEERTTRSAWCTRCSADHFHSHRGRGADAGRMAAYLGWTREPGG